MKNHKRITLSAIAAFSISPAGANELDLLEGHPPVALAENIEVSDGGKILTIQATDERKVPVFVIRKPEVSKKGYILKGDVWYEDVGGDGMLEMWNFFPVHDEQGNPVDGREGAFFSRTAGDYGPMAKLQGDSAWRPFILPFNTGNLGHSPKRLEINVLLPDGGTVKLRNLTLEDWQPPPMKANATPKHVLPWVLASMGLMLALSVFSFFRWRRRHNLQKELRRISIADTQV